MGMSRCDQAMTWVNVNKGMVSFISYSIQRDRDSSNRLIR
jgi:hypothetical protein